MASPTRTLTTNFVGRTTNLEQSFKRVAKGSSLMSDKLRKATRMAGIGFGTLAGVAVGAAAALKPMIDKAADVEEAISKNRLMFGEASEAVEQFAKTSLESFGVTRREALDATGTFGNLGKAMGMAEADSSKMATTLTGLAGDMSSLHNVEVEEALVALRAGLIGEAEPLRRFGILLDAATIKAKALETGLIKSTKEAVTPAIKSQAAYALILEKGAVAMGDFNRTSDSAVNQQKKLAGAWDDIQIQIGTALLPAFTALVTHLNEEVMPSIQEFFEDPSWGAFGTLAGEAVTSEFSKTVLGFFLGSASWLMSPVGAVLALGLDQLERVSYFAGTDARSSFQRGIDAAEGSELGRLNPDWDRGDWETAGSAAAAVFYGAAGAMVPSPLIPPGGGGGGPVVPSLPQIFGPPGTPPGPRREGPHWQQDALADTAGPTDAEILKWLGTSGAKQLLGQGPPNVTIIAPAVSGQEVVDALGQYVDGNGPLPPHWQQGAN